MVGDWSSLDSSSLGTLECWGSDRKVLDKPVDPPPLFFVSVAFTGLRYCVSDLESALMDFCVSVDSKGSYGEAKKSRNGSRRRRLKRHKETRTSRQPFEALGKREDMGAPEIELEMRKPR